LAGRLKPELKKAVVRQLKKVLYMIAGLQNSGSKLSLSAKPNQCLTMV
jgi:hypothetical protein